MSGPLSVVPALLVAGVLIISGIAKLRRPDTLAGWSDLGVPAGLRRDWLLKVHPWGEIALGFALAAVGGILGELAAIAALALMTTYLAFVVRIVRQGADVECACFGTRKRVTGMTVVRNAWYVLLAVAAVATTWMNPVIGGPLAAIDADDWLWIVGLVAAVVTVAVTTWHVPADDETPMSPATPRAVDGDGEDLDYIRTRTPSVPVTLADGEIVDLRELSMVGRPLMLLHLRPGCTPCVAVHDRLAEIRAALPEVHVRVLLTEPPAASEWTETTEPSSLHDSNNYVPRSFTDSGTPMAVLLGLDGLLAGGPVIGPDDIFAFVDDIHESLHGHRPAQPLSAAL